MPCHHALPLKPIRHISPAQAWCITHLMFSTNTPCCPAMQADASQCNLMNAFPHCPSRTAGQGGGTCLPIRFQSHPPNQLLFS